MKQQLYHTRKVLAKTLGLKWGAYHLGRPGNPVAQADHFINFAKPKPDELIALDIEHDDPKKWLSLDDAEIFAKRIHEKLDRYPVLYTNHHTAKRIAERKDELPILSRLPLWYARYKSKITGSFPMGNWESFAMWQFSTGANCNKRRCLYRVDGAPDNIDVNVSNLNLEEFDKAWPFNGLVDENIETQKQDRSQFWVSLEPKRATKEMQLIMLDYETITGSITKTAKAMDNSKPLPETLPPAARNDIR